MAGTIGVTCGYCREEIFSYAVPHDAPPAHPAFMDAVMAAVRHHVESHEWLVAQKTGLEIPIYFRIR